jgi:hypothetical protein
MSLSRRILLGLLYASVAAMVLAWWGLLGDLCSAPLAPDPTSGAVVSYNCHGRTVYIREWQESLRLWIPIAAPLLVLGVYAVRGRRES